MTDLAINRCEQFLNDYRPRWRELDPARQRVLLHMCYNMGPVTLMTFRRFWAAFDTWVDKKDNRYLNVMAREIRDSRAHQQLPNRYDKLADIMEADKHGQGMDTKGDQETGGVQGQG